MQIKDAPWVGLHKDDWDALCFGRNVEDDEDDEEDDEEDEDEYEFV